MTSLKKFISNSLSRDRVCQRRRRQTSAFQGRAKAWGKANLKDLEAGQRKEAGGHLLRWDVPGTGNVKKDKIDEVSGGQK